MRLKRIKRNHLRFSNHAKHDGWVDDRYIELLVSFFNSSELVKDEANVVEIVFEIHFQAKRGKLVQSDFQTQRNL